jgi:hypothetical protein
MRKKLAVPLAVLAASAIMTLTPSIAAADDFSCPPTVTGQIPGNVIVPPGATCIITNATVQGNVKALERSRLLISNSNVGGNVEGDKADIVQIFFSEVRENIWIKEAGPAQPPAPAFNVCGFGMNFTPCEVIIAGTTVMGGGVQIEKMAGDVVIDRLLAPGNLKVEENAITGILLIQNSTVGQNMQVFKNIGVGTKLVQSNTVGENLQCFENQPPFVGQFNTAGNAEGQCAASASP